jgi:hypothetical protein
MKGVLRLLVALGAGQCCSLARAVAPEPAEAVWQWSVPMGEGRAFLWIPEDCARVRAVVVAQHNMIEQGILEHPQMRRALAALGIAEVFIAPPFDRPFDFNHGAGERLEGMMRALADESGYTELAVAPAVPLGHSACASFPWNFAAWNPGRTLAVLSVKGDAPLTDLTGSGAPNPEWGRRQIDGIPGLMVMSEQEWWEDRLQPLFKFRAAHPATPLAILADTGHGHFDATDELVEFLALFIRKSAAARLPLDGSAELRPVNPASGWLTDRWRRDEPTHGASAPVGKYAGDQAEACWCFDEEMALAVEALQAKGRGEKVQQVDFFEAGEPVPISTTHTGIELKFQPEADGVGFRLAAGFIVPLPAQAPSAAKDKPAPAKTVIPQKAVTGTHASGLVFVNPIVGPVRQVGPDLFRVVFDRACLPADPRNHDAWLVASHPGDAEYKGAVQQAMLRLPRWKNGPPQTITFPAIANQKTGTERVELAAVSDADVPVDYYVREGPAFVRDGVLHLTRLPPRAKLPLKITVVAWQFGRGAPSPLRAAEPVERSFFLLSSP